MGMPWAWSGSAEAFFALEPAEKLRPLVVLLQGALAGRAAFAGARVVLDWRLRLLGRRIDAVVATGRAVLAVQFRPGAGGVRRADLLAAEDAALDLAEFHEGCRGLPVIPLVLVPNGAMLRQQWPLPLEGAAAAFGVSRLGLPRVLEAVGRFPDRGRAVAWETAEYAPVAGLIEAARSLYAAHEVSALRLAKAGPAALCRAQEAVGAAIAEAGSRGGKAIVFVTGSPGAGKTVCGLDVAFGNVEAGAFLTANPALVHVLREALVRDAVEGGANRRAAERRMRSVIQALPAFRDHFVGTGGVPSPRLVVVDEAQRCWAAKHAVSKTRNRAVALRDSEAGHLLDVMEQVPGWAALVCLIGGGQEIHDGEGGLAAWGEALRVRPHWSVWAPERGLGAEADRRQVLPALPGVRFSDALHLEAPVRAVRAPMAVAWVDAVLRDEAEQAARLAREAAVPFAVTRSLEAMRAALRPSGTRSAGLLASSTARRLRAEGLGAVLPHQDEAAVARWFLDRWPDIRSSDALEMVGTEFAVQGLELDRAGLCWDGDLVRGPERWEARRFRGSGWTRAMGEARSNRINAYRVLLTRARHGTVIWVPRGDARDETRNPARYDAVAAYLIDCGATALDEAAPVAEDAGHLTEPALL